MNEPPRRRRRQPYIAPTPTVVQPTAPVKPLSIPGMTRQIPLESNPIPDPRPAPAPTPEHRRMPVEPVVSQNVPPIPPAAVPAEPMMSRRRAAVAAPSAAIPPAPEKHRLRSGGPVTKETPPPPPVPQVDLAPQKKTEISWILPWPITVLLSVLLLASAGLIIAQVQLEQDTLRSINARAQAHQAVIDRHPLYYRDLIEHYAEAYNLQPAYVAAIIKNESSFNPAAESRVGARGLMQLMEDTAGWIAGQLRISGFDFSQMYDAETNIRFGCWYLNYLSRLFGGDAATVTAAYHAGQGEVSGWLGNSQYSHDGRTLDLNGLMDGPTKTYAERVTTDYAVYQALYYTDPAADAADSVPSGS